MIHCLSLRHRTAMALLILLSLLTCPGKILAQPSKDDAVHTLRNLAALYRSNIFTARVYLDTVVHTMERFQSNGLSFSNEELLELLSPFRQLAWEKKLYAPFRQTYYALVSHQARIDGRNGEMLYYAEKLNDLEEKVTRMPSLTAMSYIAGYYYSKMAYPKIVALYHKHRPFITQLPETIRRHPLDRKELMRTGDLLSSLMMAAYNTGDTAMVRETENITNRFSENIREDYASDKEILIRLKYSLLLADHQKHRASGNKDQIRTNIRQLDALMADPDLPAYLKSYLGFTTADKKALFFLDHNSNDSAAHYINVLYNTYGEKLNIPGNAYMVKKYEARLLYNKGDYKASEDTLVRALEILETFTAATVSEIDDVLYALTKVEEQQFMLTDAARKQHQSDRQLTILVSGCVLLLSGGSLAVVMIRRRQQTKFLNFKLNLARNIHDETNPALLYAKMLARAQRTGQEEVEKGELETHIEHTMELIRGLAHDLKSDQQLSLRNLLQEIHGLLEKVSALSDFTYTLREPSATQRFLSHFQYVNLLAILKECITNSIKHADFRHLYITLSVTGNILQITYRDDGCGFAETQQATGIGLQNIRERARKLNATLEIQNNYPEGLQTIISLKLG